MKVTNGLEHVTHVDGTIATLGSYDGVHIGHQNILERMASEKRSQGLLRTLVLTFEPHPRFVIPRPGPSIALLTTLDERLALLERYGVDETVVIHFTREFAQTRWADFFRETIVRGLGTSMMVVGFNHAFGKDREGDTEHLRALAPEFGVSIVEVAPIIQDGSAISSTRIRKALHSGDAEHANAWLGHRYELQGVVVNGNQLGRTLGFPTANIAIAAPKLVPGDGVYACRVHCDGVEYLGALSIGTRPTLGEGGERAIEVFLLDFDGDLYGKQLRLSLTSFLRSQMKFDSMDALRVQMAADVAQIRLG